MIHNRIKPLTKIIATTIACSHIGLLNAQEITEILVSVSPIRDSQVAAIQAKRDANNTLEVVSADTIGRFPDQNLADSLGRLPGLAIERDQGQARYINLRGAPFRYTSIAFDGIDVPGAENGRIPRFDSFPSVITSRIEVNKAILASMPGESVAGFINIHTFSPFDKAGWTLAADLGTGEQALGGGDINKLGLRASWSNENLGFIAYASENSRDQITDNREYDIEIDSETGQNIVHELDFRSYKITREDKAYGGTFEWRGNNLVSRAFISTLYSEFIDLEQRNQFVFGLPGTIGNTGTTPATNINRLLEYGRYDNSTLSNTLGMDFNANDWLIEARVNFTQTERNQYLPIAYDVGLVAVDYDISNIEDPILNMYQMFTSTPIAPTDVSYTTANLGLLVDDKLDNDAQKFKLDITGSMDLFGQLSEVQAGLQYDTREATGYSTLGYGASPELAGIDVESFNTGILWDSKTTNSIGGTYYNNIDLRHAWQNSPAWPDVTAGEDERILIEEDIIALYAMSTLEYTWGNVVLGARAEMTDYTSKGTINDQAITVNDDFTNFLPSVHLNVNLTDDLKYRLSASTGVNRPTYNEWRATAAVDVINKTVRGGNPTLEAEEASGIDTSLEWYFSQGSLLAASVFYKNIDNVIYADVSTIDGGLYFPSAAGEQWEYNGAVNGKDGKFSGIELNFIGTAQDIFPEPFDGFGVSANMTFIDSEFKGLDNTVYDLPGTSNKIYNASIFYENYGLSTRLNYQYRDEWISPIESPDEVWGEQTRIDFSLSYQFPMDISGAALSAYFNANNLTNEVDLRYAGNGTVNQRESYGRRYLIGLRLNF